MIRSFSGAAPKIHPTAFVHDSAEVIGRVSLGERASVFPGCVLRGDISAIRVGARTNIQDLTVIHTREKHPTLIGRGVTVGHRAILHGCRVGDRTLVGMGAIVMEASIGANCLVAAGAVVLAGAKFAAGRLIVGTPARSIRPLRPDELRMLAESERSYIALAAKHAAASRALFGR